ncbi:MAG: menaquinone biosynthesis protein [Nitrospirota bacterium]|nr:menaquinone biosynthesis protein [Nitrospirota bacterium]
MIRLGIVNYLNNRPVYHFLLEKGLPAGVDAVWGTPAEINAALILGNVDMGPISSIEYVRHRHLFEVMPGIGIAAKGEVGSVLLFLNAPPEKVKKIVVDRASATSVVLLRLIYRYRYGIDPVIIPMDADLDRMFATCDGALVIGDAALDARQRSRYATLDLAAEWYAMTSLPFTFALWVARRDALARDNELVHVAAKAICDSRKEGLAALKQVAEGWQGSLAADAVGKYLQGLRYQLDREDRAGMELFFEMAYQAGLVEERGSPSFMDVACNESNKERKVLHG